MKQRCIISKEKSKRSGYSKFKTSIVAALLTIILSGLSIFAPVMFLMSDMNYYIAADTDGDSKQGNGEYYIDNYDVNIIVNEDNSMEITENIDCVFLVPKHGIIRNIPTRNNVVRADGSQTVTKGTVKKFNAKHESTSISENAGTYSVRIGDADNTYTGEKSYTLTYEYRLSRDTLSESDEFYFNIIGTEWDTTIEHVSFTVTMPKEFDDTRLGFTSGSYGKADSSHVFYRVDGNVITGYCDIGLGINEGVTMRLLVPDGYFIDKPFEFDFVSIATIIASVLSVAVAGILWKKYGKDDEVVKTIEFYPPEGLNSAEVSLIYKGKVDRKDITTLLVYLASKGYIKITANAVYPATIDTDTKIEKLKEYDGNNSIEKLFMKGLFKGGRDYVWLSGLDEKFYKTVDNIAAKLEKKKWKYYEKKSEHISGWLVFLIIVLSFLAVLGPFISGSGAGELFIMIFPVAGFSAMALGIFGRMPGFVRVFLVIWGLLFGGIPWVFVVLPELMYNKIYLVTTIVCAAAVIGVGVFMKLMPKKTREGTWLYGKILGFRDFLIKVEKEKLEQLVYEDPEYFYNIMPFAYVLGVSDVWINKFEDIAMSPSEYIIDQETDVMNIHMFSYMWGDTYRMMNSRPVESGGGSGSSGGFSSGGSGGGFSGGGSGGGGGSSW